MADMQVLTVIDDTAQDNSKRKPNEEEFCRVVEEKFTPYIGQDFLEIEEAVTFYKIYAIACGFDVRKYTTKRWRDGEIKSKLLVCNREGFKYKKEIERSGRQDGLRKHKVRRVGCKARIRLFLKNEGLFIDRFHAGHNHELISARDREFQKLSCNLTDYHKMIILYNYRLKIGATKTYKMLKEHVNGFENIGASLNDFKNFHRNVKCYIHERDGQLFIDHFKEMAVNKEGFFFDYDVDSDGSLSRAIWADSAARRNYSAFGDCVSFNPTYTTNKYDMAFTPFTGVDNHKRSVTFCAALVAYEDADSFQWVLKRFLVAMGGKEPNYIITDQDPGILKAVPLVFKKARHRFCMWHIMNKVPTKYGVTREDYIVFIRKINTIIWDDDIEAAEFDARWEEIGEEHGLNNIDWFKEMFSKRNQWVMAHYRDLEMGAVMRTTQRSESENSFFKRFEGKSGTLLEFLLRFKSAMDQQRHTHKKLVNEDNHTSPKMETYLALEADGAKVYTHKVFKEFQEEAKYSIDTCKSRGFAEIDSLEVTTVRDASRDRNYDVTYCPGKSLEY
ncbi:protein FAR1-RELATED SEQUENCE 5-like [Silene latifolia]|uniref:protein FAR1-RELATED SEQUENCE 5-like n=1 Tax=Silene latifolia TaxID=37657 RepID=UPI003D787DED